MVGVSREERRAQRMAAQKTENTNDAGAKQPQLSLREVNWGRLLGYLRPYIWQMALAIVALLISTGLGLAFPAVIVQLLNSVTQTGQSGSPNMLAAMLLGIFLVQATFNFVQSYLLAYIGERIVL